MKNQHLGWERVSVVEACESVVDCVNKTAPVIDGPTPYKMIRTTNVKKGWVNLSEVKYVTEDVFEKWTRRQRPRKGDVILTREAPLGEVGMLRSDDQVFLGQRLVSYRANPAKLDNRFLLYAFQGQDVQGQIKGLGSGATVEHMRVPDCEKLTLLLPPLGTQHRIASILSAYDDLIENNTRRIAILEEMARRTYEEWFVRFRFQGHEQVKMVESEGGAIPNGWKISTLGAVSSRLQSGGTPSRSNDNYWSEGTVDWYKTKELWDGFLYDSEERITEAAVVDKKTRIFEPGTILMAIYGSPTVGRLGITTRRSACNQAALGFELRQDVITQWFLLHTLMALRQEFNNKAQGAAQQNISKEKVAETRFLLPPMPVIAAFDKAVGPMWAMLRNLQTKNRNLRTTRDLLLPKLISGQLDVSSLPEPEAIAA